MDIPFTRLTQLSVKRTEVLSSASDITPTAEGVRQFVENFSAMGLADRAWDQLISTLFYKTSKKELLVAIAVNKVALLPGGLNLLDNWGQGGVTAPRGRSKDFTHYADLLLSELRPEGRHELLSEPPKLNASMIPFITLGRTADISFDLVPASSWFRDDDKCEGWRLTQDDTEGWRKQNDDRSYKFLSELAALGREHTPRSGERRAVLCRITHMIAKTAPDSQWPQNSTNLDPGIKALCEAIVKKHGIWPQLPVR